MSTAAESTLRLPTWMIKWHTTFNALAGPAAEETAPEAHAAETTNSFKKEAAAMTAASYIDTCIKYDLDDGVDDLRDHDPDFDTPDFKII